MLEGYVSPGGKHSRPHELVGGVGLFAPQDIRQGRKSELDQG